MVTKRMFASILAAALLSCRSSTPPKPAAAAPPDTTSQVQGLALSPPQEKPSFTLTDTQGKPFDFRKETDGYVTLLFFGYTHCPDVCPVHMSNIAQALKNMPAPDASRVKVVFVTNDPDRDDATRLRAGSMPSTRHSSASAAPPPKLAPPRPPRTSRRR